MIDQYNSWNSLPYPKKKIPTQIQGDISADRWVTRYLKFDGKNFIKENNEPIIFDLTDPKRINWKQELNHVKSILNNQTKEQTEIAKYWGTGIPTKQFMPIFKKLVHCYDVPLQSIPRILAPVLAAMNDTFFVTWFFKYKWLVARPIQLDPSLRTVLVTPKHPSFPSGHATIAGTTEIVLSYFFPDEAKKLREISQQCADSRLFAGIHFNIDNVEGLKLGHQIGEVAVNKLKDDKVYKELIQEKCQTPDYRRQA